MSFEFGGNYVDCWWTSPCAKIIKMVYLVSYLRTFPSSFSGPLISSSSEPPRPALIWVWRASKLGGNATSCMDMGSQQSHTMYYKPCSDEDSNWQMLYFASPLTCCYTRLIIMMIFTSTFISKLTFLSDLSKSTLNTVTSWFGPNSLNCGLSIFWVLNWQALNPQNGKTPK